MSEDEVHAAFLARYAEAWAANDPEAIARCWDATDPQPLYKAEEIQRPFASLAAMRDYWRHNQAFHERVRLTFSEVRVKPLADDVDLLLALMRWDIRFAADARLPDGSPFASAGKAMGGDNHVAMVTSRTPDGLRLRAWIEAPDAPLSYMRRLYEQAARDV